MGLHLDPLDSGLPRFLPRLPRLHLHYPVMVTSLCTPAPTTEGTMSPSTLTPTICSVSVSACCWNIFTDPSYSGDRKKFLPGETYRSISSVGRMFRAASSIQKTPC